MQSTIDDSHATLQPFEHILSDVRISSQDVEAVLMLLDSSKASGPDLNHPKQKRSTEGCSKFKGPETRQVQERLVSTLEHMQVPKWDRTRCPEE